MDWFTIIRDYLTSKASAPLLALSASVGFAIHQAKLPHGYDGGQAIVLSKVPEGDGILDGTAGKFGDLEFVSNCYSAEPEDEAAAKAIDVLLMDALNETRYDKSESGTIVLALATGHPSTFIEPEDTRRAVARRFWRATVSAVTTGV